MANNTAEPVVIGYGYMSPDGRIWDCAGLDVAREVVAGTRHLSIVRKEAGGRIYTLDGDLYLGQRVRTTVDAPPGWEGAFGAPAGTLGTINGLPGRWGGYGVVLDGDPDRMSCGFSREELEPVE